MRTVAAALQVATSTVSKALRDDPTISAERRREIQRTAKVMGYQPNPLVATLMAQLHARRRRNDPNHIAWIDLWPSEEEAARLPLLKPLLRGAQRRAAELGYGIEVHRVIREGIPVHRLRQILIARSQWGLIIPPVPEGAMHYPLDLQGLTAVTVGTSLHHPPMNRVAPHLFQGGQLACARLWAKGFRRIGLVLGPLISERVEGQWLGAYLAAQRKWPRAGRLPPLLAGPGEPGRFRRWFRRWRPDAIVLAEDHVEAWAAEAARSARLRPATAWLLLEARRRNQQGVDYRGERIGAAAVEMVVGQIHRNERGSPELPNTLLMDGVWRE